MISTEESFEQICHSIHARVPKDLFHEFSVEKNRVKRFSLADQIEITDDVNRFMDIKYGKDLLKALNFKNEGNREFKNTNWTNALQLYNQSYLITPGEKLQEVSVVLGNRSACLYHMKEYKLTIDDISRAERNFPRETVYKLVDRKAKCYLHLGNYMLALKFYLMTNQLVLENNKIPMKQKQGILDDSQALLKFLRRNSLANIFGNNVLTDETKKVMPEDNYINPGYKFDYTERTGRYAVCTKDLDVGTLLLSETPFCSVVLEKYSQTHCQVCYVRPIAPVACDRCADIIFCSDKCKSNATFHQFECGILKTFWKSKASVTCHLSMRMMAVYPLSFFLEIRPDLERKMSNAEVDALQSRDYRKAYSLVTHEEGRTPEEMFHRTLMAKFLLNCLVKKGYLDGSEEHRAYIGNLILHNIQVLQFNAHEIFELQKDEKDDIGRTEFIGGAIYPVLALFNHSCDPATVRYFNGHRVYVRSIRPLRAGEEIGENYGPIFTQNPREDRQHLLKQQYKFECRCQPCNENWPLFKQMTNHLIRLRCQAKHCHNVIILDANIEQVDVKCPKCGISNNILERLKFLTKVDASFENAKTLFKGKKIKEALKKYLEILQRLDDILVPPYSDYHICQQGIRRCYLEYGNLVTFKKSDKCTTTAYFM
ncbi:SET and MYND domain-containing protein DDB_G0284059-like [Culicoides brevitarsis]|uniref:SET and MYND domain-containing protein DDB_G0284059-like n=1 Tax=Culicoides brevitarsis TaxID=469753 RepID=UPI00307B6DEC